MSSQKISKGMRSTVEQAETDYMLKFKGVQLPEPGVPGNVRVLSGESTELCGPRSVRVAADKFVDAYDRLVKDAPKEGVGPRIRLEIVYTSSGRCDEIARNLHRYIRSFLEVIGEGCVDSAAGELEHYPALKELASDECFPSYHQLQMAGAEICGMQVSSHALENTVKLDSLIGYQSAVRDQLFRMSEYLPLSIDLRQSLFFPTAIEGRRKTAFVVGRRMTLSSNYVERLPGGGRQLADDSVPIQSALNVVAPRIHQWMSIPPVPFGMYPGISGYHVRYAETGVEDDWGVMRAVALQDRYGLGRGKLRAVFGSRPSMPGSIDGMFRHVVCGSRVGGVVLEHIHFSGENDPHVHLEPQHAMGFVVPMEGRVKVRSTVQEGETTIRQKEYEINPGGGVAVFKARQGSPYRVSFALKAVGRSSALFLG